MSVTAMILMLTVGRLTAPPPPPTPIVGGEDASGAEWAGVASIEVRGALCTGVLVDRRVLLTAAHCLADRPPLSAITIKFGTNVRSPEVVTGAERYGIHPLYCPSRECDGDNFDVAFIQLAKEHHVLPVALV